MLNLILICTLSCVDSHESEIRVQFGVKTHWLPAKNRGLGGYLNKVQGLEKGLQQGPGLRRSGVQDDYRGPHGVTAPQLLYEVVEAFLRPTHYHMVCQLSNLVGAAHLHVIIVCQGCANAS